ncbi:DNA-directed RNA polymerase II subunit GRINL1A [Episyrphus balteatus]|uniref:DNA-directed RNA polymerase II subunit GRINL1A n=1 Tax=Episyrphus balteatus TaxID=286459 RepID=UPI00248587C1|nr:DNA-directed RNA polymerase II subunit GRINL1A [Episyrphus balteatus]
MIARPTLNRIPGEAAALKSDHLIQDLTKLDRLQLLEIKAREEKLISRIPNLNKLPDKGQRIKDFFQKVCKELERRSDIDDAAEKFSEMNIASKGEEKLIKMEWNGKISSDPTVDVIDSDDEAELDPLKIIAQRTMHEKKVINIPPEESLITQKDIEEINSFKNEKPDLVVDAEIVSINVIDKIDKLKPLLKEDLNRNLHFNEQEEDPHLQYLVEKGVDRPAIKEKYKPYQTTISNVHDPEKEKLRKKGKHWENTAATPPLIQHGATKMLSLTDSVEIQKTYLEKLKILQEKQAADRLAARMQRAANNPIQVPSEAVRKNNPNFNTYRDPKPKQINIEGEKQIDEDDEVEDLDDEKPGGVVYTVFD